MAVIRIGRVEDFEPGRLEHRSLLGRRIAVLRREDGSLTATEANCRHQNADLTTGERDGDVVTCPRHGWRYNLTTGECLNESWARLRTFRIWAENDDVYFETTPL